MGAGGGMFMCPGSGYIVSFLRHACKQDFRTHPGTRRRSMRRGRHRPGPLHPGAFVLYYTMNGINHHIPGRVLFSSAQEAP